MYVIGSLGSGGAEKQLIMLMQGLSSSEFKPELFVLEAEGALKDQIESTGIQIHDGGYDAKAPKPVKLLLLFRALWRLVRLLKTHHALIVHGFLPITNFLAVIAGRLSSTPLILTSRRALNTHQDSATLRFYMDRFSSRLSHSVTVNSRAVLEDTLSREGGNASKFSVIYNGIELQRFRNIQQSRKNMRLALGLGPDQLVLIIVANLIPYKGHMDLLDAFALLFQEYPDLTLLVVGEDRGIEPMLRDRADQLGISKSIHWLGHRDDVPELLVASDIYICASHEEGFSNSLLEAMAAEKAIVATRVGGNPEMLEEGKLGLLVNAHDPKGLSHAISTLLVDSQFRKTLGEQAAGVIEHKYAPEQMVEAYLKIYRQAAM